jgi:hypothetical protein
MRYHQHLPAVKGLDHLLARSGLNRPQFSLNVLTSLIHVACNLLTVRKAVSLHSVNMLNKVTLRTTYNIITHQNTTTYMHICPFLLIIMKVVIRHKHRHQKLPYTNKRGNRTTVTNGTPSRRVKPSIADTVQCESPPPALPTPHPHKSNNRFRDSATFKLSLVTIETTFGSERGFYYAIDGNLSVHQTQVFVSLRPAVLNPKHQT